MTRLSADERRVLVARLLDQRRTAGLSAEEVSRAAQQVGVGERTLWRWLAGDLPGGRPRSRYRLTEADRDAYAAAHGNVAAAWRARRKSDPSVPTLRTFQLAIARELLPIERVAVAEGIEGQRRHSVFLRWEPSHRNERWEADHVELPVLVLPPRATRPCRPWATLFIDTYSRLLMGWALALSPSSATVLAALRIGLVVNPERGPFGGIPMELRLYHGLEFAAEALVSVAATLGIRISLAPAYTPHLKGRIERLNRTVAQDFLCTLPFFTDGPRDAAGRLYEPGVAPLTFKRFAVEFAGWVQHCNTTRPHAGLQGQTPLDRWRADPTPVREIPAADLRFLLLAGAERTITKHGVRFGGLYFIAPELNGRVGQTVQVRWMPHDLRTMRGASGRTGVRHGSAGVRGNAAGSGGGCPRAHRRTHATNPPGCSPTRQHNRPNAARTPTFRRSLCPWHAHGSGSAGRVRASARGPIADGTISVAEKQRAGSH